MGGRIVLNLAAVVAAGDDLPAADDHRANRDVVVRPGGARLRERFVHESRIVAGAGQRARVEQWLHQTPR